MKDEVPCDSERAQSLPATSLREGLAQSGVAGSCFHRRGHTPRRGLSHWVNAGVCQSGRMVEKDRNAAC